MKKHQTYLVLLLALLFSGTMNAKVNNYIGGYGFLGEWTLRPSQSDYKPSLGVAGGAGFIYELQAGKAYRPARFLLDIGVGAWGGMTSYMQSSDMELSLAEMLKEAKGLPNLPDIYDLQGDKFDYMYEVRNRHDQYKSFAIQVPILMGFHYHRFYMLAGVKINSHIFTKAYTVGDITTYGRYEDIPELRNMSDYQFFDNAKLNGSARTSLKLDVNACLELGGRLGLVTEASGYDVPKRKIEYRFAGFIDYGLTDVHSSESKLAFTTTKTYDTNPSSPDYVYQTTSMIDNLLVNDIMSTSKTDAAGNVQPFAKSVTNLMVGVKFTILFQLPEEKKCVICNDAYGSSVGHRRGGVKYEE